MNSKEAMVIDRRWLSALWRELTGDLVSLRFVPEDAAYWGEVEEPLPGFVCVRLRADLARTPRECLKTFFHELAHRVNGDTRQDKRKAAVERYRRMAPLDALISLTVDHRFKENLADADAEAMLQIFERRLTAQGLGWANVAIDIGG